MARYLTGTNGVVILGTGPGVTVKSKGWEYRPKVDTKASRAAGDGAMGRTALNKDFELSCTILIPVTGTPIDIDGYLGLNTAFTLKTDATPKMQVAGTGLVTGSTIGSPLDDDVTIELTIECDDADVANFPVVTVA
jgi:hypothetical protein